MSQFYVASDYAGASCVGFSAYYGYEKVDADDNWVFTATFNDKTIEIPAPQLKLKDAFDPAEGLIAGILRILETHKLEVKP